MSRLDEASRDATAAKPAGGTLTERLVTGLFWAWVGASIAVWCLVAYVIATTPQH